MLSDYTYPHFFLGVFGWHFGYFFSSYIPLSSLAAIAAQQLSLSVETAEH
jgi:hypothetical protein